MTKEKMLEIENIWKEKLESYDRQKNLENSQFEVYDDCEACMKYF